MTALSVSSDDKTSNAPSWTSQEWLEPRLVVVTAVCIGLSLLGERQEWSPTLILILNIASFLAGGLFGAKGALESLVKWRIDVDMLMILAALGAATVDQWHEGAILLFLFSLSNVLQDYAIGRSRQAIRALLKLYPAEARVKRDGAVVLLKIEQIVPGDEVLIQPGERMPVDGVVLAGNSGVDQSPITGESMPVEKAPGDKVFAGTLNGRGSLDVRATGAANDTTLARIIKMVEEAQDSKAPTERFLDRFEQIYAVVILVSVALFIIIPPALGWVDFTANFYRAMVLMTVASPCALVISTPAAFISAIAAGARKGVLFKGGAYLEGLAVIKAIAFDKTGTLTLGKPAVTDVLPTAGVNAEELLTLTASVEARSEHPLAQAIINAANERKLALLPVSDVLATPGRGVAGVVNGAKIEIGTAGEESTALQSQGKTVIAVRRDGVLLGMIAMADQLRPETISVVKQLKTLGLKVAMLTGDNPLAAGYIASQLGLDAVYAGLLPEDKVRVVKEMQAKYGATAMIGDGVNDAPALAHADIGIAMGAAGSDVALETADLVLMGDRLELIEFAVRLSQKARRVVWQNISFALAVIVLLILGAFVVNLPLPLGVMGHEGSTVIVVLNGLIQLLLWPEKRTV